MKKRFIEWLLTKLGVAQELSDLSSRINNLKHRNMLLESKMKLVMSFMDIGTDISLTRHDRSWIVFCLRGNNREIVKFLDLSDKDLSEILDFLKQFKESNPIVDGPPVAKMAWDDINNNWI